MEADVVHKRPSPADRIAAVYMWIVFFFVCILGYSAFTIQPNSESIQTVFIVLLIITLVAANIFLIYFLVAVQHYLAKTPHAAQDTNSNPSSTLERPRALDRDNHVVELGDDGVMRVHDMGRHYVSAASGEADANHNAAAAFDEVTPPVSYTGLGLNIIGKVGLCTFACATVVKTGLGIYMYRQVYPCQQWFYLAGHILKMILVLIQTVLLLTNSKIRVNFRHSVIRFGMAHLIATNLLVYFIDVALRTWLAGKPSPTPDIGQAGLDITGLNDTITPSHPCIPTTQWLLKLDSFLFTLSAQSYLIAAGNFYKIYTCVGSLSLTAVPTRKQATTNQSGQSCFKIQKSLAVGASIGLLLLLLTIADIVVYIVYSELVLTTFASITDSIYLSIEISCNVLGLIFAMALLFALRDLRYSVFSDYDAEELLLTLSLVGAQIFVIFKLIAEIVQSERSGSYVAPLSAGCSIIIMMESIIQAGAIKTSFGRHARNSGHAKRKPGQTFILLLIITNICLLLVKALELEPLHVSKFYTDIYGTSLWALVVNLFMPVAVYYRYHSASTSGFIYSRVYDRGRALEAERNALERIVAADHIRRSGRRRTSRRNSQRRPDIASQGHNRY